MKRTFNEPATQNEIINQTLNFFWTIGCFLPVLLFWMGRTPDVWLYGSVLCSIAIGFLPGSFFKLLQLSQNPRFYKKYGVTVIRRYVQNGDLINRLYRQKSPQYKVIKDPRKIYNYRKTIAMYERYHFTCFVFFLLTTILSLITHHYTIAILITGCNIIYNVCPIFLQQYNRLRIQILKGRI